MQKWYDAVAQTTETTKNLLCLAPQVRAYHERAYFALKPIDMNEEKTRLDVIFSWLPRFNYPRKLLLSTPPLSLPSTVDRRVHDSQTVKMWDTYTDSKICTGDKIVLETTDKDRLPLPDAALLDMQWVLQRVAALSAGAEPVDEPYDDYDYDDDVSVSSFPTGTASPRSDCN